MKSPLRTLHGHADRLDLSITIVTSALEEALDALTHPFLERVAADHGHLHRQRGDSRGHRAFRERSDGGSVSGDPTRPRFLDRLDVASGMIDGDVIARKVELLPEPVSPPIR